MKTKLNKSSILIPVGFIVIAFIFVCTGSYSTSFFSWVLANTDSAVFQIIGKAWCQGYIPYLDLWDIKGPYIYFVNALGYKITGSVLGLVCIQVLHLFIFEIFIYKIFRFQFKPLRSFLYLIIVLGCYFFMYYIGNFVEEFCLPFLSASIYFQFKWLQSVRKNSEHPSMYALVYGITLGICLCTRLTNFVGVGVGVFIITIYLIAKHKWANLFKNIGLFLLGFCVITGPFLIYFMLNGAFEDMLYGVIFYPSSYVQTVTNFFEAFRIFDIPQHMACASLLIVSLVGIFNKQNKSFRFEYVFWFFCSAALFLWLVICSDFRHYFIIAVPYFALFIFYSSRIIAVAKSKQTRVLLHVATCIVIIICVCGVPSTVWNSVKAYSRNFTQVNETRDSANTLNNLINDVISDPQFSFTCYDCPPDIYLKYNIIPYNKYFAVQSYNIYRGQDLQNKVAQDFQENQPQWLLTCGNEEKAISDTLRNNYVLYKTGVADNYKETFFLYKKNS